MDELEISGKRYISTRRAGRDYKYHSDYIGQLIRGKKVIGKKVGRSWYVEEASLTAYLNKEAPVVAQTEPEPVEKNNIETKIEEAQPTAAESVEEVPVVEPVVLVEVEEEIPATVVAVEEVKEKVEEVSVVEEVKIEEVPAQEKKEVASVFDSVHIPIRRISQQMPPVEKNIGLTYIEEEAPALPEIKKLHRPHMLPHRELHTPEPMPREGAQTVRVTKRSALIPLLSVASVGLVVLAVVAASSVLISSHTVVEAGKTASVEYSFR